MWWYYLGQAIGGIAVAIFFISYLCKTQKKLLLLQTLSNAIMFAHYFLIGADSGYFLAVVAVIRNLAYYFNHVKFLSFKIIPYIFAVIVVVIGAFSWEGYHSLFYIVGLGVNTVFMSVKNVNVLRISVIFTCALIFTYNVFALSIAGMINESLSIVGAIIGLISYAIKNKKREKLQDKQD